MGEISLPKTAGRPYTHFRLAVFLLIAACGGEKGDGSPSKSSDGEADAPRTPVKIHQKSVAAMGTFFNFTIASDKSAEEVDKAAKDAADEIARIEQMMSTYIPTSPLSRVNKSAGIVPVQVPDELISITARALEISDKTEGKFDVTFGAIGKLWKYRDPAPAPPSRADIEAHLPLLDYKKIEIDKTKSTLMLKERGMSIGLGAIAKGYAVDKSAEILRGHGIHDFIVYGGGDIYISGKKGAAPWRVGIQDPRNRARYFADFAMERNGAVVTSGDYEKFFMYEGKRYHHILDPDTGYPAEGTVSVTLVTSNARDADALATGVFALGPEKGMALIESDPDLEGVIVDTALETRVSSGLKKSVTMRPIQPLKGESQP